MDAITRRPAVFIVLLFAGGIIVGEYYALKMMWVVYALGVCIPLGALFLKLGHKTILYSILAIIIFILGAGRITSETEFISEDHIVHFVEEQPELVRIRAVFSGISPATL